MDVIRIHRINIEKHRITARITPSGKVKEAFMGRFYNTYEYQTNIDLTGLPESIAAVPILADLLPVSWVYNTEIRVDTCDRDFYDSIPEFKQGFIDMYPKLKFGGKLTVKSIVENPAKKEGSLCLFSGGVDATNTVLDHMDEKLVLMSVRGADIEEKEGYKVMLERNKATAELLGLPLVSVEANFRSILNTLVLDTKVLQYGDAWWHGFQHGLALLSVTAPITWQLKILTVYIASSFTEGSKGHITCASDPSIDNYVRFGGTKVIHDGYEMTRLDKLRNISSWCKANDKYLHLRVCIGPRDGNNCCHCEKCWRTILALYAIGEDPTKYGFHYESFSELAKEIHQNAYKLMRRFNTRYMPIIKAMHETYTEDTISDDLRWLYNIDVPEDSELFDWMNEDLAVYRDRIKQKHLALEKTFDRRVRRFKERVLHFPKKR